MKKELRIAWCAIGASIGVLIGTGIWKYWDYKKHPELYIQNSAPWYTGLLIQGAFTLLIVLICIIVLVIIGRKKQ